MATFLSTDFRIWPLFASIYLLGSTLANAETYLGKEDIPANMPAPLRELVEQTYSEDFEVRRQAALQLGKMGERAAPAVPFVTRLLGDDDPVATEPWWRSENYARGVLLALGDPALDQCILEAGDPASPNRFSAISMLTEFKDPRAGGALAKLLHSPYNELREYATSCFRDFRDRRSVDQLLKILAGGRWFQEGDYSVRLVVVVEALGNQGDERAVGPLLAILRNPKESDYFRAAAAASIGKIGKRSTYPILVDMLLDPTLPSVVRAGAASGLGFYPRFRSMADLMTMGGVRDDERVLALLGNLIGDEDQPLVLEIAATRAMAEMGNPKALRKLTEVANSHPDESVRFWAAVGVVNLSEGPIDDAGIVRAVKDLYLDPEGDGDERVAMYKSMDKIKERGSWRVQLAYGDLKLLPVVGAIILALLVGAIAVLVCMAAVVFAFSTMVAICRWRPMRVMTKE